MTAARANPSKMVILLVDDEEIVRQVTRRTLELGGYEVLVANDGQEALDLVGRTDQVDLVISDMQMPRMTGRALADRLVTLRPTLPVLLISGFPQYAPATPALGFLSKPFSPTALLKRVAELIPTS